MKFVDTSAWFAAYVPTDPLHGSVRKALEAAPRLVTTDYIVDETLTLLRVRGHSQRALSLGRRLLDGQVCRLEFLLPGDVQQAWIIFSQYRDKA